MAARHPSIFLPTQLLVHQCCPNNHLLETQQHNLCNICSLQTILHNNRQRNSPKQKHNFFQSHNQSTLAPSHAHDKGVVSSTTLSCRPCNFSICSDCATTFAAMQQPISNATLLNQAQQHGVYLPTLATRIINALLYYNQPDCVLNLVNWYLAAFDVKDSSGICRYVGTVSRHFPQASSLAVRMLRLSTAIQRASDPPLIAPLVQTKHPFTNSQNARRTTPVVQQAQTMTQPHIHPADRTRIVESGNDGVRRNPMEESTCDFTSSSRATANVVNKGPATASTGFGATSNQGPATTTTGFGATSNQGPATTTTGFGTTTTTGVSPPNTSFAQPLPAHTLHQSLALAASNGQLETVKCLIATPQTDLANTEALKIACQHGHLAVIVAIVGEMRRRGLEPDFPGLFGILATRGDRQTMEGLKLFPVTDTVAAKIASSVMAASIPRGHVETIKCLVQDIRYLSVMTKIATWVENCIASRQFDAAILLIEYANMPDEQVWELFLEACRCNATLVMDALMERFPSFSPSIQNNSAIKVAVQNGHREVVAYLLRHDCVVPACLVNCLIGEAAQRGHIDVVAELLKHPDADPAANESAALRYAAEHGHLQLVSLLCSDPRMTECGVHPAEKDNYAIRKAAAAGHVDVVRYLCADLRVDPTADANYALRWAARYGFVDVVTELLTHLHVVRAGHTSEALGWAAQFGHDQVVELLLYNTNANPAQHSNYALRYACRNGHPKVVRELLACEVVDPTDMENAAFQMAARFGHTEVVRLLLQDPRVEPGMPENTPLKLAASWKHLDVVLELIDDGRADCSTCVERVLQLLLKNGRTDVAHQLCHAYKEVRNAFAEGSNKPLAKAFPVFANEVNAVMAVSILCTMDVLCEDLFGEVAEFVRGRTFCWE